MELRKKSLLIALAIGNNYLDKQYELVKGKTCPIVSFQMYNCINEKEYFDWKVDLCRKLTGKICKISERFPIKNKEGRIKPLFYGMSCNHKYFRILRKWLYPNDIKVLNPKYLSYLTEEGLALWYIDVGYTYISQKDPKRLSCEFYINSSLKETLSIIEFFNKKWKLNFHLHKKGIYYSIRIFNKDAVKFINIIKPYVPECMAHKIKIPNYYIQERMTS